MVPLPIGLFLPMHLSKGKLLFNQTALFFLFIKNLDFSAANACACGFFTKIAIAQITNAADWAAIHRVLTVFARLANFLVFIRYRIITVAALASAGLHREYLTDRARNAIFFLLEAVSILRVALVADLVLKEFDWQSALGVFEPDTELL